VLVVVHLPRDRHSLLPELFAARCRVKVKEAEDKEPISRGTVYFAPPDYHLLVERSHEEPTLALSVDDPVHFSRPSIDVLFETAAEAYGSRLLGVILTGANADGASGLQRVRREGGQSWVQSPEKAYARGMPEAAIAAGPVDDVLSLEQIASRLGGLGSSGAM
jgi:two-component system chemotaxis response regulator CheB